MEQLWYYWINEPIYMDKGVTNIAKRKHAIYMFCKDGLLPLLRREGFVLIFDAVKLTRVVLRLLFSVHQGKQVLPYAIKNIPDEIYQHYCHMLDTMAWDRFWQVWGVIEDFDVDNYAYPMRGVFQDFLWSWIDFDVSPSIETIIRELEEDSQYDDGTKGKDDPYLQETKRDYQDRHW